MCRDQGVETIAPAQQDGGPVDREALGCIHPEGSSRKNRAGMGCSHHGLKQRAGGDWKGQSMQIGTFTTGEVTDPLKLVDAHSRQSKIIKANRQSELIHEIQQLTVGLRRQAIATQPLFESQLHKNAETDFFTVQDVVTGLELGQSVVHGMGSNRAAASASQSAHHSGCECTCFGGADPGCTVAVL